MLRRGFTLVEILIAMAVFLIGIVAILALFPVGINSSRISTDQSVAAALAESLDDALTLALRQYDGVAGTTGVSYPTGVPRDSVDFYHDGLGKSGHATFELPPLETWDGDPTQSVPAATSTSNLGNGRSRPTWYPLADATVAPAKLDSIRENTDTSPTVKGGNMKDLVSSDFPDPLGQYSFRFMCHEYKNPNDIDDPDECPYTLTAPSDIQFYARNGDTAEVVDKLFQFTLYVYRGWVAEDHSGEKDGFQVWAQDGASSGNQTLYEWEDQMKHTKKIERFEFTIYAQGARQP